MEREQPDKPDLQNGGLEAEEELAAVGWRILRRIRQAVNLVRPYFLGDENEDLFRTLYLTPRQGYIPEHLRGHDVMEDIINLYYHVFDELRNQLYEEMRPREGVWVYVQPDCVDPTAALVVTDTRVP